MLSTLHVLNFLNYTVLREFVSPPVTRSVLLVVFALVLLVRNARNLPFHIRRSWDVYAICLLALSSAAYSVEPTRTLQYGAWLLLSVYVGTELAVRICKPSDVVVGLCIVLLPVSVFTAFVNVLMGPVVMSTGRQFGALGSTHVDTAYAMNFICLFLALRVMPGRTFELPKLVRVSMLAVLVWAFYQSVFGLTRSVWLAVTVALGLYFFRRSLSLRSLLSSMLFAVVAVVAIDYVGLDRLLPDAVRGRIEVTEQRIESGEVDPRLEGIRGAYRSALKHPEGTGYAVASSHNSYMNLLLNLGWVGFLLSMIAIGRSFLFVAREGFRWLLFFAIGSGGLLLHAFFEVQTWPGQANFIPLLTWYALSRSRFAGRPTSPHRARYGLVGG